MLFSIPQTNTYIIVPLKIAQKIGEFAESATVIAESKTFCRIHKQLIKHLYRSIELLRNPQL